MPRARGCVPLTDRLTDPLSRHVYAQVTLAVGPTLPSRGRYPGDPGAGLLPGFRDTCDQRRNLGRGGANRYARKWLERRGVRLLESWAVPPPQGATLGPRSRMDGASARTPTVAARPDCARSWRDAGASSAQEAWAGAYIMLISLLDCRLPTAHHPLLNRSSLRAA